MQIVAVQIDAKQAGNIPLKTGPYAPATAASSIGATLFW